MISAVCRVVLCGGLALPLSIGAQMMQQMQGMPAGERIGSDEALSRALKTSSLTTDGRPFHAVLEIGKPGDEYSGRVEVWWRGPQVFKLQMTSPKFSQTKVVNGDRVSEKDDGDYYPRWLENFVLAILDPIPVMQNFRGRNGAVMVGQGIVRSCVSRDDRPGGITDQMTWGQVCFRDEEPKLMSVDTTNINFELKDWKKFDKKQIARTVTTDVEGFEEIEGRITTLEELKNADPAMFEVRDVTPPEQRIATKYVSTLTEEGMLEKAPVIEWPSVREGKTDGYMIVYARTDRTGQVRETAKHNSDQPGLEDFGIQVALKYKFKPLVVNGAPMQMEMPLVLHFTSKLNNPLPILSVEEMQKQMTDCATEEVPAGAPILKVFVSVNEEGKLTGEGSVKDGDETAATNMIVLRSTYGCKFLPYVVNGKATYYHGYVVEARSH